MSSTPNKTVIVHNALQKNYRYECIEKPGKNFDKTFHPSLTPKEMLELGVFGGVYLEKNEKEFPASWFTNAKISENGKRNAKLNYFGVNASQSREIWLQKGWINEKYDPRGWFEWYCRYYLGRRLGVEDERQIKRWNNMRRHIMQIKNNCRAGDEFCRPRQRQALLHWAYDSRRM